MDAVGVRTDAPSTASIASRCCGRSPNLRCDDPTGLPFPTGASSRDPRRVEQIRIDAEALTNFHPERLAAWTETAAELDGPIDDEVAELLNTALGIEREL